MGKSIHVKTCFYILTQGASVYLLFSDICLLKTLTVFLNNQKRLGERWESRVSDSGAKATDKLRVSAWSVGPVRPVLMR